MEEGDDPRRRYDAILDRVRELLFERFDYLNARLVQVREQAEAGELTDGAILLGAAVNDVEFVLRVLSVIDMSRAEVGVRRAAGRLGESALDARRRRRRLAIVKRLSLAVVSLVLVLVVPMSTAFAGPSKVPPLFRSCKNLNKKYPHGVGRPGAHDHGSYTPPYKVSARLYNLAMSYNRKLDADRDGIACEK